LWPEKIHNFLENNFDGKSEKQDLIGMRTDLRAVGILTEDMTEPQVIEAYRVYILWLENVLLFYRQEIEK
jgi:hypothetical protein